MPKKAQTGPPCDTTLPQFMLVKYFRTCILIIDFYCGKRVGGGEKSGTKECGMGRRDQRRALKELVAGWLAAKRQRGERSGKGWAPGEKEAIGSTELPGVCRRNLFSGVYCDGDSVAQRSLLRW